MDLGGTVASDSAWAQRSLTSAPHWREAVGTLVYGGALQLRPGRVPALPGPPARILSQSRSHGKLTLRSEAAPARRRPDASETGPALPLRERLLLAKGIPKESKVQLIRRLEELDKGIPPYLRRRPSWILHEDEKQPAAAMDGVLTCNTLPSMDPTQLQASTITITTATDTAGSSDDDSRYPTRGSDRSGSAHSRRRTPSKEDDGSRRRRNTGLAVGGRRRRALVASHSAATLPRPSTVERAPSRGMESRLRCSLREALA